VGRFANLVFGSPAHNSFMILKELDLHRVELQRDQKEGTCFRKVHMMLTMLELTGLMVGVFCHIRAAYAGTRAVKC
jgi:hypothetical protein